MFIHYTIYEDRSGDDATVKSVLLAALGARSEGGYCFQRKNAHGNRRFDGFGVEPQHNIQERRWKTIWSSLRETAQTIEQNFPEGGRR
jgi:hypothetical protein